MFKLMICGYYCCDICSQSYVHAEIHKDGKRVWRGSTFDLDYTKEYIPDMREEIQTAAKSFGVEFDLSSDCDHDWETDR
jgi:hypothetical protein